MLDKKKIPAGDRPAHKDRYFSVEQPKTSSERNRRLFRWPRWRVVGWAVVGGGGGGRRERLSRS